MRKKKTTDLRGEALLARMAAYLAAQKEPQARIAATLEVSQPTVSRLLRRARTEGWLVTTTKCQLSPRERREVLDRLFERRVELVERIRQLCSVTNVEPPSQVWVFHGGTPPTNPEYPTDDQLAAFGRLAATRIREITPKMGIVGLAWGKTICCLRRGLQEVVPEPLRTRAPVTFIPLCGEPSDYAVSEYSASTAASSLHQIINGSVSHRGKLVSLGSTPARIPASFKPSEQKAIRKFIHGSKSYQAIFLPTEPLVDRLDTVLTSVGNLDSRRDDPWLEYVKRVEEAELHDLAVFTPGDLGGVFLTRANAPHAALKRVQEMNERWTGVTLNQLRSCCQRARKNGSPGVILLAAGKLKAEITRAAIQQGVVNELIIDRELGVCLLDDQP